jgi:VCBS repeat-containing protein
VAEDQTLNGNVTLNDSDADGDALTATLVSGTSNGSLAFNADGTFTYQPAANFSGSDTFTYKLNDGQADSNVATVTITITSVNDAPTAASDSFNTVEDVSVSGNVLANDADIDSGTLTAALDSDPSNGTLTFNSDGSFTYHASDGQSDRNIARSLSRSLR